MLTKKAEIIMESQEVRKTARNQNQTCRMVQDKDKEQRGKKIHHPLAQGNVFPLAQLPALFSL